MNIIHPSALSTNNPELGSSGLPPTRSKHYKDIKMFSSLGSLQSRINFIHTCLSNSVIPTGFRINWKEQTGLGTSELSRKVSVILDSASISLMKEVLDASTKRFHEMAGKIVASKNDLPDNLWQKGIQSYNFCFKQCAQRLTKKLKKISALTVLQVCLPHTNLSTPLLQNEESVLPLEEVQIESPVVQQYVSEVEEKIMFTPDMIFPIPYDEENFKPISIDDVTVPEDIIELCAFSPSFSPTPHVRQMGFIFIKHC